MHVDKPKTFGQLKRVGEIRAVQRVNDYPVGFGGLSVALQFKEVSKGQQSDDLDDAVNDCDNLCNYAVTLL